MFAISLLLSFQTASCYIDTKLLRSGTIIGNSVSGAIIHATGSWANVFYVAGIAGGVWFILFTVFCYNHPDSHPFITEKEKRYLRDEIGELNVIEFSK